LGISNGSSIPVNPKLFYVNVFIELKFRKEKNERYGKGYNRIRLQHRNQPPQKKKEKKIPKSYFLFSFNNKI